MNAPQNSVIHVMQSDPMADDALIRIERLRALGLSATELSTRIGGRSSYWSDMLRGQKSFGEKVARKTEEALGLDRGYLDNIQDRNAVAHGLLPAAPAHLAAEPTPPPQPDRRQPIHSRMAMDLAIEFDMLQGPEHLRRLIHAHCMLLINKNPMLMRQLGIDAAGTASHSGAAAQPTPAPDRSHKKSPSTPRA